MCSRQQCFTCDPAPPYNGSCFPVADYERLTVSEHGRLAGRSDMMAEIKARGPISCTINATRALDKCASLLCCRVSSSEHATARSICTAPCFCRSPSMVPLLLTALFQACIIAGGETHSVSRQSGTPHLRMQDSSFIKRFGEAQCCVHQVGPNATASLGRSW